MSFSSLVHALDTKFVWNSPEGAPHKGGCFEIDIKTNGNKFRKKSYPIKCRPDDVQYQWVQDSATSGKCFELDNETGGFKYFDQVNSRKCIPKNAYYKFHNKVCFALDENAYSSGFSLKVANSNCHPGKGETFYFWKNDELNLNGNCYERDKATNGNSLNVRVGREKCLPKKVTYFLKILNEEIVCAGMDEVLGASAFVSKFPIENCRDLLTFHLRDTDKGPQCYIVFNERSKKTSLNKCRPDKTEFVWKQESKFDGKCYEVDSSDQKFVRNSHYSNCFPGEMVKRYIQDKDKLNCVYVDVETQGVKFTKLLSSRDCKKVGGKYFFKLDKKGHGGRCYWQNTLVKEDIKEVHIKNCRPEKVKYVWVKQDEWNGRCYEVDEKELHKAYSKSVNFKYCKPSDFVYKIRNEEGKDSRCYEVGIDGYIKQVELIKCKKGL